MLIRPAACATVLGIALLSGCSVSSWNKPGSTQQDLRTDYNACAADAHMVNAFVRPLRLAQCMGARGYKLDGSACRGEIAGIPVQCSLPSEGKSIDGS